MIKRNKTALRTLFWVCLVAGLCTTAVGQIINPISTNYFVAPGVGKERVRVENRNWLLGSTVFDEQGQKSFLISNDLNNLPRDIYLSNAGGGEDYFPNFLLDASAGDSLVAFGITQFGGNVYGIDYAFGLDRAALWDVGVVGKVISMPRYPELPDDVVSSAFFEAVDLSQEYNSLLVGYVSYWGPDDNREEGFPSLSSGMIYSLYGTTDENGDEIPFTRGALIVPPPEGYQGLLFYFLATNGVVVGSAYKEDGRYQKVITKVDLTTPLLNQKPPLKVLFGGDSSFDVVSISDDGTLLGGYRDERNFIFDVTGRIVQELEVDVWVQRTGTDPNDVLVDVPYFVSKDGVVGLYTIYLPELGRSVLIADLLGSFGIEMGESETGIKLTTTGTTKYLVTSSRLVSLGPITTQKFGISTSLKNSGSLSWTGPVTGLESSKDLVTWTKVQYPRNGVSSLYVNLAGEREFFRISRPTWDEVKVRYTNAPPLIKIEGGITVKTAAAALGTRRAEKAALYSSDTTKLRRQSVRAAHQRALRVVKKGTTAAE